MTAELVGSLTHSPGREVMSASLDVGDGVARPLSVVGSTWRVTAPLAQEVEETRSFTITAVDATAQQTSMTVSVRIDTLGPRAALSVPSAGTAVSAMTRLEGAVVDPAAPVMSVTVDVGSGPRMAAVAANGAWHVDVAFPANLDRVQRPVTIAAVDALGNLSTRVVQVLVDTQGPAVAFISPAASERLGVPRTEVLLGSATDGSGVVSVAVDCGDTVGPRPAVVAGNTWSVSWLLPTANGDAFTCIVTATDALSNVTIATRAFTVDTVPPSLYFLEPAPAQLLAGSTMRVLIESDRTVALATATFGGQTNSYVPSSDCSCLETYFPVPLLDFVSRPVSVLVRDAEGNEQTATRMVTIDRVAPVITISAPSSGQIFNAAALAGSGAVDVAWAVTDGDPQAGTQFFNGSSVALASRSASVATSPADDGRQYTRVIVATDSAGNISTASRTFTVDRVAPTVVAYAPAHNTRMNSGASGVSVQFSEPVVPTTPGLPILVDGVSLLQPLALDAASHTYRGNGGDGVVRRFSIHPATCDRAGNPIVNPPSWTAHFAPGRPANGAVLATGVIDFDAASDLDGEVLVGTLDATGFAGAQTVAAGGISAFNLSYAGFNSIQVQASRTLNGITPELRWSINGVHAATGAAYSNARDGNGAVPGTHVAAPPLAPEDGFGAIGQVVGGTYFRAGLSGQSMGFHPMKVISSGAQWLGLATTGQWLQASRRECAQNLGGTMHCGFTEGLFAEQVAGPGALTGVTGAASSTGCLVVSYDALSGRRAAVLPKRSVVSAFQTGVSFATVAAPGAGFSVAPRSAGGFWAGWVNNGVVQLAFSTDPTTCTGPSLATNWTMAGSVSIPAGAKFRVVQAGLGVAVVYLEANSLRIAYP